MFINSTFKYNKKKKREKEQNNLILTVRLVVCCFIFAIYMSLYDLYLDYRIFVPEEKNERKYYTVYESPCLDCRKIKEKVMKGEPA